MPWEKYQDNLKSASFECGHQERFHIIYNRYRLPSTFQSALFNIQLPEFTLLLLILCFLLIILVNLAFALVQVSLCPSHLADSDDSLLGDFVSEDVEHVHAVSTDDGEIHLRVLPDVSVSGFDSPNWSARVGWLRNSELVNTWKHRNIRLTVSCIIMLCR